MSVSYIIYEISTAVIRNTGITGILPSNPYGAGYAVREGSADGKTQYISGPDVVNKAPGDATTNKTSAIADGTDAITFSNVLEGDFIEVFLGNLSVDYFPYDSVDNDELTFTTPGMYRLEITSPLKLMKEITINVT